MDASITTWKVLQDFKGLAVSNPLTVLASADGKRQSWHSGNAFSTLNPFNGFHLGGLLLKD